MQSDKAKRQGSGITRRGEEGVALLTTLMIMLILTVLGLGAVGVTALENRIAGFQRTGESAASAVEACIGTSVNIIQQTIANAGVPGTFVSAAGPVPTDAETGANPTLTQEIMGESDNHGDVVTGSGTTNGPDYMQQINGYDVKGDIDRLYLLPKTGSGMQFAAGYEGAGAGSAAGGVDVLYRIDCRATLTAVGTENRLVAVYACTLNGECQKKIS